MKNKMAACGRCTDFASSINRRKKLDSDLMTTELKRCLSISDLIFMGIGNMVGAGIFLLTGQVVRYRAGASAMLSYVIASIAASLSAICYAEFAAFVPLAGSTYTYTYVVIGELWAFFVGINIFLEYILTVTTIAKSWSGTLDAMLNGSIGRGIEDSIGGFDDELLGKYPDFVAVFIIFAVTVFVIIGAKVSATFNKVMVCLKLATIAIIIFAGLMLADISNWIDPAKGGFMPYGFSGTLSGAATCIFAFLGLEGLAVSSEETENPKRAIPISIMVSMIVVTLLYVLTSAVLTLMIPYYDVYSLSPYPEAFAERGQTWTNYVVGLGTLFGFVTVLLSGLFASPRILFAMARDGLLFSALGYINPKTQTPIIAIVIVAIFSALLATFFELIVLVDLMSIGTLYAYTFIAASIILIRYEDTSVQDDSDSSKGDHLQENSPLNTNKMSTYEGVKRGNDKDSANVTDSSKETICRKLRMKYKNILSRYNKRTTILTLLGVMGLNIIILLLLLVHASEYVTSASWWAILLLVLTSIGIIIPLLIIGSMEQVPRRNSFQVPWVPLLPAVSMFCNLGLMMMLDWLTWIRLLCWMCLGALVYFFYGMKHSEERNRDITPEYIELNEAAK